LEPTSPANQTQPKLPFSDSRTRFVEVTTADHTAQHQFDGTMEAASRITDTYTRSPLAAYDHCTMETDDNSRKKLGECKDHAADGKKVFNISAERKTDVIIQDLGRTTMEDKDLDTGKKIAAMLEIDDDDLQAEGGISALELAALWAFLVNLRRITKLSPRSNVERSKLAANVLEKKLGQEKFDALSEKH
jgi:hypothetical protein